MAKILSSLSSKYNTLQTAWDSVDLDHRTLENLHERLIRKECRLSAKNEEKINMLAAAKRDKNKKSDGRGKGDKKTGKSTKNVECYKCHEMGHFVRE